LTPGLAVAYGFASFGNPLILWENPWKILGIALKILGFSFELTLISLSESSLFKDLRRPLGPFFLFQPRFPRAGSAAVAVAVLGLRLARRASA